VYTLQMASWVYGRFPEYVPVAVRRAKALARAGKLEKKGRKLDPVKLDGKSIARSFWGKAWCKNIESYSDYSNRLPRGRTYLRSGAVVHLLLADGCIEALVAGSSLYQCKIDLKPLARKRWKKLIEQCGGQIDSTVELLQGRVPEQLLESIVDRAAGLFPSPSEMEMSCSCPDSAQLCKHLAAVLYGVGARLDRSPEHFFTLRSVKLSELVAKAQPKVQSQGPEANALESIFGIEIDRAPKSRKGIRRA
jgi:uncharacterized Zn finger protein